MQTLLRRLAHAFRRRRLDAELLEEMAFHRDMKARELEASGVARADVEPETRKAFGSAALAQDRARDVWVWPWLQDVLQDVRFAARVLVKDRRFTFAAVLALALGMAANSTVFTFINAALIRDLPFPRPRQLMSLAMRDAKGREAPVSYADFVDWREALRSFEGIAASAYSPMNVSDEGRAPDRFRGAYLSANAFELLRAQPLLGRGFLAGDERPGAPAVVVLGHDVWTARYNADPGIVGRTIRVNDLPAVVVGVMPAAFGFPGTAEVWQPLSLLSNIAAMNRSQRTLSVVGRLRDGVTVPQARVELAAIGAELARRYPDTNRSAAPAVAPLLEGTRRFMLPQLFALMGAVLFVLLIACANVANLLLARAAHRSREIAIRASLGATRWRIVRQLAIESLLLALVAGAIGLVLAVYGVRIYGVAFDAMETGAPDRTATPYWINLGMNGTVFGFVAAMCLGSSLVFGLAPALHVSRTDVQDVLKESGRAAAGSVRARRWTGALMIAELALTLVLLTGAGLMVRSFLALYLTDLVIDSANLTTARVGLPLQKYPTPESRRAFFDRLDARLAARGGFDDVALASDIPFGTLGGSLRSAAIEGDPMPAGGAPPTVSFVSVGPRYFGTLGLHLRGGRLFSDAEQAGRQPAAIVNQRFATMFFATADAALGRRIRVSNPGAPASTADWLTIVAVAPTLPQFGPRELNAEPLVYVPAAAERPAGRFASIVVRSRLGLAATAAALREEAGAIDPDLPLYSIQTLDDVVARMRFPNRLMGSLFVLIAAIALTLATVGLFALTAHGVAQRTQEIGIRMALGAHTRDVVWLFVRRTAFHLAVGLAIGLAGALAIGRLLEAFLVRTGPRDPITLALVTAMLVVVSAMASVLPARRASRIDPAIALRSE